MTAGAGHRDGTVVEVRSAGGAYPVVVRAGLRHDLPTLLQQYAPAFRYALISDDTVAPLYGDATVTVCRSAGLKVDLFTFPTGERNKTRRSWSTLTDQLLATGLGRDGVVVALGGGVTGDLAGFVASTFLRGIPVVQVPTSIVAMVDASVGGKTGVDVRAGKNLVGSFHPPRVVAVDPETVKTLPERERAQGLVEAVKHGAVIDAPYLDRIEGVAEELLDGDVAVTTDAVLRSVEIKAGVVGEDEREGGLRQILNFGHTYGHALEAASDFALGHGAAVAAGMVLEARLGERLGVTESGTANRLESALARFGFADVFGAAPDASVALEYLGNDKKARSGSTRFVLLRRLGEVDRGERWTHAPPAEAVAEVLRDALS